MAYRLEDKWIWDFWFARHDDEIHMFYLQADRALKDEALRHWNVSIGHAVSTDLIQWTRLDDALTPQAAIPSAPDSKTTWTGSILPHGGRYYMFYTGGSAVENGLVQRICLAVSEDLMNWQRHVSSPLLEADSRWYEKRDSGDWVDESWRDPWVFWCTEDQRFHMLITGRVKDGPPDGRGTIAHAVSDNLIDWAACAPLVPAGRFAELEVPQIVQIRERYYLLFSTSAPRFSAAYGPKHPGGPETGVHYFTSHNPLGPYQPVDGPFWIGDQHGSLYSGKLVQDLKDNWHFMAFRNFDKRGGFVGDIEDPRRIDADENGRLIFVPDEAGDQPT